MNVSSISNNVPSSTTAQPLTADLRQARATQNSSATQLQTTQAVAQTEKTEPSRLQVEEAVKTVNDFLQPINNSINFSLDKDTGITVVKVIDVATKEVVRQIPSEEMLTIAKAIDQMKGLLVQQKA